MSEVVSFEDYHQSARSGASARPGRGADVFFDRRELDLILDLYGFMVAAGEWRDYAIGHDEESCCFAVFQRAASSPLYRIVKTPKLAKRQGAYSVLGGDQRVLKRGKTLAGALKLFRRKRFQVV